VTVLGDEPIEGGVARVLAHYRHRATLG